MKKIDFFLSLTILTLLIGYTSRVNAQSSPVMYFCEKYGTNGEVNISDRFYTGYLTVMVKADDALGLRDVSIQFDKYNCKTGEFDFYKKFNFTVQPDMKYIYFEKNEESDMSFNSPGIYRVFLLDSRGKTVTSALIEIIR
jgi:hypothetical protein